MLVELGLDPVDVLEGALDVRLEGLQLDREEFDVRQAVGPQLLHAVGGLLVPLDEVLEDGALVVLEVVEDLIPLVLDDVDLLLEVVFEIALHDVRLLKNDALDFGFAVIVAEDVLQVILDLLCRRLAIDLHLDNLQLGAVPVDVALHVFERDLEASHLPDDEPTQLVHGALHAGLVVGPLLVDAGDVGGIER